jgi:hypothetical protein
MIDGARDAAAVRQTIVERSERDLVLGANGLAVLISTGAADTVHDGARPLVQLRLERGEDDAWTAAGESAALGIAKAVSELSLILGSEDAVKLVGHREIRTEGQKSMNANAGAALSSAAQFGSGSSVISGAILPVTVEPRSSARFCE